MKRMNEKSIFLQVVGGTPKLRVLDFLITFQAFDYSLTDIARNARVSYSNLMLFWPQLVNQEIVKQTRVVGKAKMFKLNMENPFIQELSRLQWISSKMIIHKKLDLPEVESKITVPA